MTTPSGQIGLSDVNVELGFPSTTSINMNQSDVRTLAGVGGSGTVISMNNLRGKSNRVAVGITLSSNTTNYNIYNNRGGTYSAGKTDVTVTINSGVVVYSTSTGTYAMDTGTGWASGDTITIVNSGVILGKGGNGGGGGSSYGEGGGPGNAAGPALRAQFALSVNNLNRISGGGGGGGGGNANQSAAGGGGGGGIGEGSGGGAGSQAGGSPAGNGQSGTLTANGGGGGGGFQPGDGSGQGGGSGGSYGSSGSSSGGSGGAAGAAVAGNSYITWINTGTRNGAIT